MKRFAIQIFLTLILAAYLYPQTDVIQKTQRIVNQVIEKSFAELKTKAIEVKTFQSESDYFKVPFSFSKYPSFQKMRYIIFVNPQVFERNVPENGIPSIVAHELAHVLYYTKGHHFELLGLGNLSAKNFTRKFERGADLEAMREVTVKV